MTKRTYTLQINSPAGGYEANSLTLEGDAPHGLLGDFLGTPIFLGKGAVSGNAIMFDTMCGTICGDYRIRIEATPKNETIAGTLSCAMGSFPFTGKLQA